MSVFFAEVTRIFSFLAEVEEAKPLEEPPQQEQPPSSATASTNKRPRGKDRTEDERSGGAIVCVYVYIERVLCCGRLALCSVASG